MSAESPRHVRSGGPLTVPSQPPSDRSIIDAVSGFINDVTLSSSSTVDPKDIIQWARFETADINEPTPEGDGDNDLSPLLLILGYGSGVQVWLVPPLGSAQEVLSWRQGTVRVLRILPTPQHGDCFASKRPLIALCDSASPGPSFCSLSFISVRGGEQVKSIKFKSPILDVLANKRSVVVSFSERFAVFDAATLEDRMAVTTCYPCPCPLGGSALVNPIALGDRWLAYADKKLNQSKRSSGGCEGEGVTSYTATVLHAAKSLSKGLRGLGESVAHSLAGGRSTSQSPSPPNTDTQQPGVVTVLDIESNEEDGQDNEEPYDPMVAHFVAHSEAIIALKFDASGMLLVTADRRGHDFHVFRINPHPCGPSLASVHHLYVLHRGDTTAKVQDIAISPDSRWAAISTLRGTTHIFPMSPYGGSCGVRTHTSPRVVNRLSRFHRSAGLPIHPQGQTSGSPVSDGVAQGAWFPNPRLPPYPLPATVAPLAQLRPTANLPTHTITRTSSGRQRLSSLSEECNAPPLLARARFGQCVAGARLPASAALYLLAGSGCLSHIALHPRPARGVSKEKICDDSPIELEVEPVAQWPLQRPPAAADLLAPLPPSNPLLQQLSSRRCADMCMSEEERWLSQVEIVTHAGPHRRLWMGPQFVFKTYNCTGSNSSLSEAEAVEVDASAARGVARSNPVNMPGARPLVPVLVGSGSASSLEQSPSDSFRRKSLLAETGRAASVCDVQLKEDLAEAMKEDHGWSSGEEPCRGESGAGRGAGVERAVDPLGTVVVPPASLPPPPDDADAHTRLNADEGTFRPVVRAPAALPLQPDMVVRPLPRTTTIPVQTLAPRDLPSPDDPLPLNTDVVIPAALTAVSWHLDDELHFAVHRQPEFGIESVRIAPEKETRERGFVETGNVVAEVKKDIPVKIECKIDESTRRRSKVESATQKEVVEENPPKQKSVEAKPVKTVGAEPKAAVTEKEKAIKIEKSAKKKACEDDATTKSTESDKQASSDVVSKVDSVDLKRTDVNKDLRRQEIDARKRDSARERGSVECAERVSEDSKSLPKSIRPSDDIQPTTRTRVKKSPTPKSVSDRDSEVSVKDSKSKKIEDTKDKKEPKESKGSVEPKEVKKLKDVKEAKGIKEFKESKDKSLKNKETEEKVKEVQKEPVKEKEPVIEVKYESLMQKPKNETESKSKKCAEIEIRTEDQAWDMLLNEPEKPAVLNIDQQTSETVNLNQRNDEKLKSKRNRKMKKTQDDVQTKSEDDSFVEIHAIEEKQQPCSGDLVSISSPYEDIEPASSYLAKAKKQRSPKSCTPEKNDIYDNKAEDLVYEEIEITSTKQKNKIDDDVMQKSDIEVIPEPSCFQIRKDKAKETCAANILKSKRYSEGVSNEPPLNIKESSKSTKSKSLSPYFDKRKQEKSLEILDKDVYVINTSEEHFPEIQITRGSKPPHKRSPQPVEKKIIEKEPLVEKPVKSWSSIAASKSVKKVEELEKFDTLCKSSDNVDKQEGLKDDTIALDENKKSSTPVSLQDKLFELCKRTDIMVAECDAPTELNFIDEHHSVLHDLPPLEPLDFGLDDFNLEVMRDSLLDVNDTKLTSPICKINIDDILSSIKETTSKVIQSSTFNLIDLEKVPAKKERGFSVVESHKITSQEIKIDDKVKLGEKEREVMDKSSDDEVTSAVVSTDSDKDDKKNAGASNIVLPSSKQSVKSKKSRRKKK